MIRIRYAAYCAVAFFATSTLALADQSAPPAQTAVVPVRENAVLALNNASPKYFPLPQRRPGVVSAVRVSEESAPAARPSASGRFDPMTREEAQQIISLFDPN